MHVFRGNEYFVHVNFGDRHILEGKGEGQNRQGDDEEGDEAAHSWVVFRGSWEHGLSPKHITEEEGFSYVFF